MSRSLKTPAADMMSESASDAWLPSQLEPGNAGFHGSFGGPFSCASESGSCDDTWLSICRRASQYYGAPFTCGGTGAGACASIAAGVAGGGGAHYTSDMVASAGLSVGTMGLASTGSFAELPRADGTAVMSAAIPREDDHLVDNAAVRVEAGRIGIRKTISLSNINMASLRISSRAAKDHYVSFAEMRVRNSEAATQRSPRKEAFQGFELLRRLRRLALHRSDPRDSQSSPSSSCELIEGDSFPDATPSALPSRQSRVIVNDGGRVGQALRHLWLACVSLCAPAAAISAASDRHLQRRRGASDPRAPMPTPAPLPLPSPMRVVLSEGEACIAVERREVGVNTSPRLFQAACDGIGDGNGGMPQSFPEENEQDDLHDPSQLAGQDLESFPVPEDSRRNGIVATMKKFWDSDDRPPLSRTSSHGDASETGHGSCSGGAGAGVQASVAASAAATAGI
mmetsp:Transcript_68128/g.176723  ORF Transcript_68128/g.176723 Transcript_68128/m.176723 type:complete len:454 (+) Transcript_68128:49-1410(+)